MDILSESEREESVALAPGLEAMVIFRLFVGGVLISGGFGEGRGLNRTVGLGGRSIMREGFGKVVEVEERDREIVGEGREEGEGFDEGVLGGSKVPVDVEGGGVREVGLADEAVVRLDCEVLALLCSIADISISHWTATDEVEGFVLAAAE